VTVAIVGVATEANFDLGSGERIARVGDDLSELRDLGAEAFQLGIGAPPARLHDLEEHLEILNEGSALPGGVHLEFVS
jgi:hypothetical protein